MADKPRPAEFDLDKKWDRVIDLGLRRTVYGTLAAGIAGLALFRGASTRIGITGIGAGFGAGSAYADSQKEVKTTLPRFNVEDLQIQIQDILKVPAQSRPASQN